MGGVNRGVGVGGVGLHVSKERGDLNKGGMKKERGGWYTFQHYGTFKLIN